MINELAQQVHKNARDKGFFDQPKNLGEMLCLIHSEVSEALGAIRQEKYASNKDISDSDYLLERGNIQDWDSHFKHHIKNTFEDELADIVIRIMDLCAFKNIDLEWHIKAKMRSNELREFKHGKQF